MSLEQALIDHAAVLREFIAKFAGMPVPQNPVPATPAGAEKKLQPSTTPTPPPKANTTTAAPSSGRASSADKSGSSPAKPAAAEGNIPPYETVHAAVLALVQAKGRAAAIELLGTFEHKDEAGAKAGNGKHLKPADYAKFIKAAAEAGAAS